MAKVADDRFNVHRDDRLVLDDQHVGKRLPLDLFECLCNEAVDVLLAGADQISGVLGREAFKRGQEQRLT